MAVMRKTIAEEMNILHIDNQNRTVIKRPKAQPRKKRLSELYEIEIAKPSELKKLKEPSSYGANIEIFNCGTKVTLKLANITGMITAISIRFNNASYEITYFDGNCDAKTVWANECEFTVIDDVKKIEVGFRQSINQ